MGKKSGGSVSPSDYSNMEDNQIFGTNADDFDSWDSKQLANFLSSAGLMAYKKMVLDHKITGKFAHLLTDDDLRDMGMIVVGDRLRFKQLMMTMGRKSRFSSTTKSIWSGEEQKYYSGAEQFCCTCLGLFPDDPTTYKLTRGYLKIKTVQPISIGPFMLCCCFKYSLRNIDLSKVNDIEVIDTKAPCPQRVFCCAPGMDFIEVHTIDKNGKVVLKVKEGDGERVSGLILNQVESAQVIDRD